MAVIKVILGGCGIKYTDANGNARHVLKTPEHGAFECDDRHAASLVRMGRAVYVVEPQPEAPYAGDHEDNREDNQPEPSGDSGKLTGHLDPAELETMTNERLKNLAADMGIDVSGCKKKADYVAAIAAVEVDVDEATDTDDDDELPELSAADPE